MIELQTMNEIPIYTIIKIEAEEAEEARDVEEGNERIEHILRNRSCVIA